MCAAELGCRRVDVADHAPGSYGAKNRLTAVWDEVPPDRLELSSSAPEAGTLSTELRGRTQGFYHEKKTSEVFKTSEVCLWSMPPLAG